MIRTIIIDDEAHVRDTLRRMLARHCPQVEYAGEASGVADGIQVIKNLHPELVILDINLGDGTAGDLIKSLDKIDFKIILISASTKSLTRELASKDFPFLLKPLNPMELNKAVEFTAEQFKHGGHTQAPPPQSFF
jgi:two-component system LytT family response regulator